MKRKNLRIEKQKRRYISRSNLNLKTTSVRIKKAIDLLKMGKLLDVGTISGHIAEYLQRKGFDVHAVDIVEESVEFAKERGIKAYKIDVEKERLPFEDNFFVTIFAGELIEHLLDPDFFVNECYRVLREDGVFVITIPNLNSLRERIRVLFGYLQMCSCAYSETVGHMRDYNIKEIEKLLNKHKFKISKLTTDTVTLPRISDKKSGKRSIPFIGKLFPTLGDTLIIQANKVEKVISSHCERETN